MSHHFFSPPYTTVSDPNSQTQKKPSIFPSAICNEPCVHGRCAAPGECHCHKGWTGPTCEVCIPLAGCNPTGGGCVDPSTNTSVPDTCFCNANHTGTLCDGPECDQPCVVGQGKCIFKDAVNNVSSSSINYCAYLLLLRLLLVLIITILDDTSH